MDAAKLAVIDSEGKELVLYEPFPHVGCEICDAAEAAGTYDPKKATQRAFHASEVPNLLALGTRGTGKSLQLRMDFHLRCLMIPNFHALIVRRTMPELRRSHLVFIDYEMKLLGGVYLSGTSVAKYPNGSTLTLAHCETEADVMNFLSSQYGAIGFDELSTFSLAQFLQISSAARAPLDAPYTAVVRASSNPLGIGSGWMYDWFVDRKVRIENFPDYVPDDYACLFSTLKENPHLDRQKYAARLGNLPKHVRRAWLLGERVIEGQYFEDFEPGRELVEGGDTIPWHVIDDMPTINGRSFLTYQGLNIYRCLDWGFFPDPAVCLWVAVLPNRSAIAFKERSWLKTVAKKVAEEIKRESEGMNTIETFCDPTMFMKTGQTEFSIGEIMEQNGVPLTQSISRRDLLGYAIHEYLDTIIDEWPQLRIVRAHGSYGCRELIRTLPQIQMDKGDPTKMADGEDHWTVALAFFCSGSALPSQQVEEEVVPFWCRPKIRRYR